MFLGLVLAATLASAPEEEVTAADNSPTGVDPIVVTGERTLRSVRDTPSSVVVLTQDAIESSGADRLDQLLELVPNVQIGSGEEAPAIRGQDSTGALRNLFAFLGGTRPRVTLQIDGRPVTYYEYVASSAPVWEVDQVEVFRSPQTTTQGRNSIAGAIFIETADPAFAWQGRGRMMVGDFATRHFSAALSGPVIADQLAVGLTGDLRLSRMASDMFDGIAGADIDRDDYGQVRFKTVLTPTALSGLRVETAYVHTRSQSPQFEAVQAPFRERRFATPERTNGIHRINVDSLTARLSYNPARGVSLSGTLSAGDARVRRFGLPGLGLTEVASRDYSAEWIVRRTGERWSALAGLNYFKARQHQSIDITGLGLGAGSFRDRQESMGLFAELMVRPITALKVTAGIRRQRDVQRRVGKVGAPPAGVSLDYDGRFDAWLPKLSVQYDLDDATSVGALVQRAYNPGGTSISLARRAEDSFEAETLWNYEMFLRSEFADGRGSLATNLFYNDIENAQRQQLVPIVVAGGGTIFATEFANAPRARTYGVEADLAWRADDRLSLRLGAALLRTQVLRTVFANDPTLGKEFQRSPRFSSAVGVDWRTIDPLRLSASLRHHGRYFSDDANTYSRQIGQSTTVDLRAIYTAGSITLLGYARNAFNSFALNYLFTPTFGAAQDPRELGVGVEARF